MYWNLILNKHRIVWLGDNLDLTIRKIFIWLSKNCQKLDIFSKKIAKNFHFSSKNCQRLGNFLTFKWQFSGGSDRQPTSFEVRAAGLVFQISSALDMGQNWIRIGTKWDTLSGIFYRLTGQDILKSEVENLEYVALSAILTHFGPQSDLSDRDIRTQLLHYVKREIVPNQNETNRGFLFVSKDVT